MRISQTPFGCISILKIALSSRNYLLNKRSIDKAGFIAKQLIKLKFKISYNKENSNLLINDLRKKLSKKFDIKIEYLEARNIHNLKKNITTKKYKLFIAYYIDDVRLIDNF